MKRLALLVVVCLAACQPIPQPVPPSPPVPFNRLIAGDKFVLRLDSPSYKFVRIGYCSQGNAVDLYSGNVVSVAPTAEVWRVD